MKFSADQDVEASVSHVFAAVSDFDGLARKAMRRGVQVTRLDNLDGPVAGMAWEAVFSFRGKARKLHIELVEVDAPNGLSAKSQTKGLDTRLVLGLVAMSKARTRMSIELELMPQSLAARLLVQSLKLARGTVSKRLKGRLAEFAKLTAESYRHTG
ncbi:SRPBCC family protein [uncultured Lentibacter sp.]|jgi:uncharacterized protein YndB with AHSA1/START domain|uniref:SRPBCC family protein n=1 Tax=uncultured Lentibacter sp. TaxID=1659309 RepID=UPI002605ED87|nr:SRPBCC family protein [uncultured Lentibacter sp.]